MLVLVEVENAGGGGGNVGASDDHGGRNNDYGGGGGDGGGAFDVEGRGKERRGVVCILSWSASPRSHYPLCLGR